MPLVMSISPAVPVIRPLFDAPVDNCAILTSLAKMFVPLSASCTAVASKSLIGIAIDAFLNHDIVPCLEMLKLGLMVKHIALAGNADKFFQTSLRPGPIDPCVITYPSFPLLATDA